MTFPWHEATIPTAFRATIPARAAQMRERDVLERARLMKRLGRTQRAAAASLRAYVAWEFEGLERAALAEGIDALVARAYKR